MSKIDPITHRLIIASSIFCSGVLFALAYASLEIYNELAIFSNTFAQDYNDFNQASDKAWNKLINLRQKENVVDFNHREKRHSSVFGLLHEGRSQNNNQCNCGVRARNCPPGTPGPPGNDGDKGEIGYPGEPGTPGAPGITLIYNQPRPGCITCPPGPPGQPGNNGMVGRPGPPGERGRSGNPGREGQPGVIGPPGDAGNPGHPGSPGPPGEAGEDGIQGGKGMMGPRGSPGQPGPMGEMGNAGLPSSSGLIGPMGERGLAGSDGQPGMPGRPGPDGPRGLPGKDMAYCPCPQRSSGVSRPPSTQYVQSNNYDRISFRNALFRKMIRAVKLKKS